MPLPTAQQVMFELQHYKTKNTTASIKQELLTKLQSLDQDNVDDLTAYLQDLLNNKSIEKKLKKILYKASIMLGQHFPRNQLENTNVVDPILFDCIAPQHLFISMDRYQWSIVSLANYFMTKNNYQNPVTRTLFAQLDIKKMKVIARKSGVTIRLEPTAPNNPGRGFDATTMMRQLYGFFSSPQRTTNNHHSFTTTTVAIPYAGGMAFRNDA